MKRFIILLAVLLFGAATATPSLAAHGHERFDIGNQNPQELQAKIDASLKADPSGNLKIDAAHCQPNGDSCATPMHFLVMFQKADPDANLTSVAQLHAFLGRLVITDAPKGEFWMACLVKKHGKVDTLWNCVSRPFHDQPGRKAPEKAWMDPLTKKVVLAEDCANPVGEEIHERDCDEHHIWLHAGDELHGAFLGPDALPVNDVCRPALKKAGQPEWTNSILDECPRENCDYSGPLADERLRKPEVQWQLQRGFVISFQAPVTGEYIVRVPRFVEHTEGVFVYCDVFADGTQTLGKRITKAAYGTGSLGWAYIDFPGSAALSANARAKAGWHGKVVHEWHMSSTRAFKGERPPITPID